MRSLHKFTPSSREILLRDESGRHLPSETAKRKQRGLTALSNGKYSEFVAVVEENSPRRVFAGGRELNSTQHNSQDHRIITESLVDYVCTRTSWALKSSTHLGLFSPDKLTNPFIIPRFKADLFSVAVAVRRGVRRSKPPCTDSSQFLSPYSTVTREILLPLPLRVNRDSTVHKPT